LIAVDGTALKLPDFDWVGDEFGWHVNQTATVASTRLLFFFDVLNKFITRAKVHPREKGEVSMAYELIDGFPPQSIAIYDRAYASYAIPFLHLLNGTHCLIRLPKNFGPKVTQLIQSDDFELLIKASVRGRSARALRKLGYQIDPKHAFPLRLIKVVLPSGEIEILLTTLLHRRYFHYKHFGGIYHKRWGVETSIFVLKTFFQAAIFSSYTLPGISQDLWAQIAMYNVQSMMIIAQQEELQSINQKRRYDYQINRNIAIGLIKRSTFFLFTNDVQSWYAKTQVLLRQITKQLESIRIRDRPRTSKIMRINARHHYEHNYKSTM